MVGGIEYDDFNFSGLAPGRRSSVLDRLGTVLERLGPMVAPAIGPMAGSVAGSLVGSVAGPMAASVASSLASAAGTVLKAIQFQNRHQILTSMYFPPKFEFLNSFFSWVLPSQCF